MSLIEPQFRQDEMSDSDGSADFFSARTPHLIPIVLVMFIVALAALGTLSLRQHRQIQQLSQQLGQQEKLNVNRLVNDMVNLHKGVDQKMGQSKQAIDILSKQLQSGETGVVDSREIVEALTEGVCLIQGEYMFVDPQSNMPLRYIDKTSGPSEACQLGDGQSAETANGHSSVYPASIRGEGPPLLVQYTGTGFLVDERGFIVTNKHVTAPWDCTAEYQHVIQAGYAPRLLMFRAFFPYQKQSFALEVVRTSEVDDVALLKCDPGQVKLRPLPCDAESGSLSTGDTVIVLGYPTGFDLLLARMSQSQLNKIAGPEGITFAQMGLNVAEQGLILPIATRGMCGRVTGGKIIYDAQTAIGASGAPVINSHGKVVAINTALLKGFSGTNFGIPIACAMELLEEISVRADSPVISAVPAAAGM
jgi:serine protease Do